VIILVIILVVAAVGGVAAYVIMQFTGVFGTSSVEPRLRWTDRSSTGGGGGGSGVRDRVYVPRRLEEVPQGCLVAVLAAMALWILAWLVVLVIGLRVLLA
jgi:hypothetical protein